MPGLDTGNTGFMLLCTSLVMLMTPGLAFFYGGLVGRKNVLAIMMQSFVSMGWTTVLWFVCRLLALLLGADHRRHHRQLPHGPSCATSRSIPPSPERHDPADRLLRLPDDVRHHHAGADHRRLRQPRHLQGLHALPDRLAAVRLLPVRAHDLGRRACSQKWGVLDFAGGIVVHNIAGIAALASVLYVGKRSVRRTGAAQHSAGRAGHRPALVRLVRLQRRQRVPRRFRDRRRLPQHRPRGLLRRHRLAGAWPGGSRRSRSSSGC